MIARLSVFDMQYKERAHFSMYRVLNNFRPVWPYKGLCTANRGEMVSVPHSTPCRDCAAKPPHDPARRSWGGEEARRSVRYGTRAAENQGDNFRAG